MGAGCTCAVLSRSLAKPPKNPLGGRRLPQQKLAHGGYPDCGGINQVESSEVVYVETMPRFTYSAVAVVFPRKYRKPLDS